MKKSSFLICRAITASVFAFVTTDSHADVTKADNTTALNLGASYTGGVAPTASDLLIIDGTLSAARSASIGGSVSVLGIAQSSAFSLTVGNTSGATLTIGASGISEAAAGGLTINSATSLGGDVVFANAAVGGITFNGALTLTADQTWNLGGTSGINNRINVVATLTTGGNTLDIFSASATKSILNFQRSNTLSSDISIGPLGYVYVQGGGVTVTFNNTANTNSFFSLFNGGTANIASMGNLGGASSIGKGAASVSAGTTLNYTGNTFSSDKGFSGGGATTSTVNVTTAGQTLSMSGNLSSSAGTGGWTFGGAGNLTLSGIINNNGGTTVTKNGAGTLTLAGANTYAGATTVSGGNLQVGSSGAGTTGAGDVTVQSGGTILGTGVVRGTTFTAQSGSTVQAGDGTAQADYGTLNFTPASGSGTFDFQSGSSTILGLNPGGAGDLLSFNGLSAGTLNFNGGLTVAAPSYTPTAVEIFNLIDWANITTTNFDSRYDAGSYGGYLLGNGDDSLGFDLPDISASGYAWDISQFTTNGTISTVIVVPEPSRALLMMLGLAGLVMRRKRP